MKIQTNLSQKGNILQFDDCREFFNKNKGIKLETLAFTEKEPCTNLKITKI